jgi:hypothetical protein
VIDLIDDCSFLLRLTIERHMQIIKIANNNLSNFFQCKICTVLPSVMTLDKFVHIYCALLLLFLDPYVYMYRIRLVKLLHCRTVLALLHMDSINF